MTGSELEPSSESAESNVVSLLNNQALVLNKSWIAITTTTVRQALILLYKGAARAIRPDTYEAHGFDSWSAIAVHSSEPSVATVSSRVPVPEVIQLISFDGIPTLTVSFSRRRVLQRDQLTCQYCGAQPNVHAITIDHILPRSRGGRSTWENCVVACQQCNRRKGDRLPQEAGLKLRTEPGPPRLSRMGELAAGELPPAWAHFVRGANARPETRAMRKI